MAAAVLAVPATASADMLYDQLDNQAANTTPSYFYEDGSGDEQAADDFTVPAGQAWTLTGTQAPGPTTPGTLDFRVTLFTDAAGKPGSQVGLTQSTLPASGPLYTFPLSAQLQPGHYWISIQVMNLATWGWTNRSLQGGSPAMWQNPDGSEEPECVTWTLRTTCEPDTAAFPDQAFSVLGTSAPLPTTPPATEKKKCKKHKKKHKRSADSAKKKKCKKHKKKHSRS
jgi:hypothetical protein